MARTFEDRTNGTLLTAVILAGMVSVGLLGDYSYFGVANAHLSSWASWLAVPLCGVTGGLGGGLFSRILIESSRRVAPISTRYPLILAFSLGRGGCPAGLAFAWRHLRHGIRRGAADLTDHVTPARSFGC
jgi:H+/Cl- antiporter ClcA